MALENINKNYHIDVLPWTNDSYKNNKATEVKKSVHTIKNPITAVHKRHDNTSTKCHNHKMHGNLEHDIFEPKNKSHKKKAVTGIKVSSAVAILLAALAAGSVKNQDVDEPAEIVYFDDISKNYQDEIADDDYSSFEIQEETIEDTDDIETQTTQEEQINPEVEEFLCNLESTQGLAWSEFDTLCEQFGYSEEEMAQALLYYCNDENWGKGCIDPVLLCAQIYHESYYIKDKPGDNNRALGLGQFHTCAVDDVNRVFGTDYTYEDRKDPQKALEMMVLYLRYCRSQTDSKYAMLAMYNAGRPDAIEHEYGQNYVSCVLEKINKEM